MNPEAAARWSLEQEARALLTRLGHVRPFALQETMLPAASLSPGAQVAIERFLIGNRFRLRQEVLRYLRWLHGEGRHVPAAEMQRRFTIVRLRFNDALTHFDLFSELVTQRSEHDTGVWLSGLDVLAGEALSLPGGYFEQPDVVCYLARGPGAAIRRARTRLPGGGQNPVAIVRVPRERMVGHGLASSLVHEVGHQAAALLGLVESLRPALHMARASAPPAEQAAWGLWERWLSEIVADFWSIAKIGIGSTLGLIGVVSLPAWFVFRINENDPHPTPWVRVKLSCAVGNALYPHRQWHDLARLWEALYPTDDLDADRGALLGSLEATSHEFVALLVEHRPAALRGHSLREALPLAERTPERLAELWAVVRDRRRHLRDIAPSLAFAVLGHARSLGELSPEHESRTVESLLTYWALRSTLDTAQLSRPVTRTRPRRSHRELQPA